MFTEAPRQTIALHPEYTCDVLRLDLIHPEISGNKWFKLKENIVAAKSHGHTTLLTFGGAYSNHIAATAAACKLLGINSIGIIRGEEPAGLNSTLQTAQLNGMQLHFMPRKDYAKKADPSFLQDLQTQFGPHWLVPEGGSNSEGIEGCRQILDPHWDYDYVLCACGTGTTFAGLMASAASARIIGISVLKGENTMPEQVRQSLQKLFPNKQWKLQGDESMNESTLNNHAILSRYALNGYAAFHPALIAIKEEFQNNFDIPLDYVYTCKLMLAAKDLMQASKFPKGSKVLLLHSGGLQGNVGFETRYQATLKR